MKTMLARAMGAATRLTTTGRLGEATALIQRVLTAAALPAAQPATQRASAETGAPHAKAAGATATATARGSRARPTPGIVDISLERVTDRGTDAGAAFITASFSNEAGMRDYKLYIPRACQGRPLPLIVMLHGCTQTADDFAAGTRMNALAEEHGLFVAYPVQAKSANLSKCWNWFKPGDQQRDRGEPSLIAGITRQIMRDYPIDEQRVYVAGLSAGGAQAAIMAAVYPDVYAAAGIHSGLACGAATTLASAMTAMQLGSRMIAPAAAAGEMPGEVPRQVPVIVFHGDKDTTVHPSNSTHIVTQLAGPAGLQAVTENVDVTGGHRYSRTCHTDSNGACLLEMWVVHGAGHAWSGGSKAGSFTDPHGPDASREMVRFFLGHRRADQGLCM